MNALLSATRRTALAAAPAAAALLLVGASTVSAAPVVWDTGSGGNGNTYDVVFDNTIDWNGARSAAQARGGDLVTITSQQEQDFVESILLSQNATTGNYWFGLIETGTEGVFEHVDGTATTYTNWGPTEPNNFANDENVGGILWSAETTDGAPTPTEMLARRGGWNDLPVSGYPIDGLPLPPVDAWRAGYLIEITADDNGGGGGGNPIPLPAAAYAFPMTAGIAGIFYRRMRRGA